MSLRDFVKKGKFDAISVEEFGAVLQMLSDPELGDRAMEAARRLIERSSGKDSVALANTLITFISAKSEGTERALKLLPIAIRRARESSAYAVSVITSLLDDERLRGPAVEALKEIAKDDSQAARLAIYKLRTLGISQPELESLGESKILTKGFSAKHPYIDMTDEFTTREGLRKVLHFLEIGPSYPLADAVVAVATMRPEALVDFLAELVKLIDKYSTTLPDVSLRLMDALELVKVPDIEYYLAPLAETAKKTKDLELKKRIEAYLKRVAKG